MQNNIETFKNEQFGEIRTLQIDTETWFAGKDVAEILGYTNPLKAIRDHVDEDDKGVNEMDTPGGKQNIIFINESGMYSLIFSSKLDAAKKFKHWVTKEVLPSIRKHGMYITQELLDNNNILEQKLEEIRMEKSLLECKTEELKEIKQEYAEQRSCITKLTIKTGQKSSYLPNLVLQVIREYVKNNKDSILSKEKDGYLLKRNLIFKELNNLIMRKQDILYVLMCMGIDVEDRSVFIKNKFMDESYEMIENCLF